MILAEADKLAAKILHELTPFCERIEVAGSVRRRRENVNDIDLVVIPKNFAMLRNRIRRRCTLTTDGDTNLIAILPNKVQLDIFVAQAESKDLLAVTPTNFGALFLCRTGSREHNIWIAKRAQSLGMHFNPYYGLFRQGKCVACATEEDMFKALDLEFVKPEQRER